MILVGANRIAEDPLDVSFKPGGFVEVDHEVDWFSVSIYAGDYVMMRMQGVSKRQALRAVR